jgi:hypothetical protein
MPETNQQTNIPRKIPVHESALVQRYRRHHARSAEQFHVTRSRWFTELGAWHVVGPDNGLRHVWHSIDELIVHAREAGLLAPNEEVVS